MSNGEKQSPGNNPVSLTDNLTVEGFLNRINEANKFNFEIYSKLKNIRNQLNLQDPKKESADPEIKKEPTSILEKMDEHIKSYEQCNALSNDAVSFIQEYLG